MWFSRTGKWGGCAGEDCVLTWGDLRRESGAEVSRGHSNSSRAGGRVGPFKLEAGSLETMKDRTKQEPSDPTLGRLPEDAERLGIDSTQCGGRHGEAPAESETWLEQVLDPTNTGSSCITEPR